MKRFFLLLACLGLCSALSAQTHTEVTVEDVQTITALKTFSSGVTLGPVVFANLGTVSTSTTVIFVSDATLGSSPCTGGGTGSLAVRINGAWNCNSGATGVPPGADKQCIYNSAGAFAASTGCTFNNSTNILTTLGGFTGPQANINGPGGFNVTSAGGALPAQSAGNGGFGVAASGVPQINNNGNGWVNVASAPSALTAGVDTVPNGANGATSIVPLPAVYKVQGVCSGAGCALGVGDLCDKINTALKACPTGSQNTCKLIVTQTTPGTVDVCASGTSDFWQGVGNIGVEIELDAAIQLKAAPTFPAAAHFVHGVGSNQLQRGTGFIMDPSFATNLTLAGCSSGTVCEGPFPAGSYRALVIDGGRTGPSSINQWQQNAFGGFWQNVFFDCNFVANCIAYYTANEQESSGFFHVRVWGTATNSATSAAACGFWDHYAATTGNSGPSHFNVDESYCDPYTGVGGTSTGTTTNNTLYGWVYEALGTGGNPNSGGNIRISGGTIRGAASNQLMKDGVWIDMGVNHHVGGLHCEWMSSECVMLGGNSATSGNTSQSFVEQISDVNNAVAATHFGATTSGNIAIESDNGVTDDFNSCNPVVNISFYTQYNKGQGYWNNGYHVCGSANTDVSGNLAFSASTSQTYTFAGTYSVAPQCQLQVTSNAGTTVFWATATTTVLTVNASASFTGNVNYQCTGRGI